MQKKVVVLLGPTGSGKTMWAKEIARKFNGKIISADSRQIFRGLDIGTGKDLSYPQALIDIINPDEPYSVAQFQKDAEGLINQYLAMKALPMIVGGTGLYIDALIYGYIIPDLQKDSLKLRESLEKLSDSKLLEKLKKLDPESALKIDPKNRRRIIRAIEVTMLGKKPFSALQKKVSSKYEFLILGIKTDRETLYAKIDARIDQMIKDGLVEEVRTLVKKYGRNITTFNTIGYKEIIDYIDGRQTLKEAIEKIKFNTHAYVRRQDTWFRRDKNIKWVSTRKEAENKISKFLKS